MKLQAFLLVDLLSFVSGKSFKIPADIVSHILIKIGPNGNTSVSTWPTKIFAESYTFFLVIFAFDDSESRLHEDLTKGYNTIVRPVEKPTDAIVVKFDLALQQIVEVVS